MQAATPFRFRRELPPGALGVAMNIPTLLTLALVLAYPIYYAAYLSFHKVSLAELRRGSFPFVGLANYQRIFDDRLFLLALKNTLIFTAFSVTVELVLAMAIALLIDQQHVWTSRITKFLILVPYAVPPIAGGLIWSFLYSFEYGFLNRILFTTGLSNSAVNWAGDPATALFAVSVPYIWRTLPFAILLLHAALQGIQPGTCMRQPRSTAQVRCSASGTSRCHCCGRSSSSSWCCARRSRSPCSTRCWRSPKGARAMRHGSPLGTATRRAFPRRST